MPPHRRSVNTALRHDVLVPSLTGAENVAFGLEMARVPKAGRTQRVAEPLAMVHSPAWRTGSQGRSPASSSSASP